MGRHQERITYLRGVQNCRTESRVRQPPWERAGEIDTREKQRLLFALSYYRFSEQEIDMVESLGLLGSRFTVGLEVVAAHHACKKEEVQKVFKRALLVLRWLYRDPRTLWLSHN